jgi:hypothetical protein
MRRMMGVLQALSLDPLGRTVMRLACPPAAAPAPGLAVFAAPAGDPAACCRTPLFASQIIDDGFISDAPPPSGWQIGDQLDLLPPSGRGFQPPAASRQWLLVLQAQPATRLLPLGLRGLQGGVEVAVFSPQPLAWLPAEIEVAAELAPAVEWADYVAVHLPEAELPRMLDAFGGHRPAPGGKTFDWLIDQPMPCGLGACGACARLVGKRLLLACRDGPVLTYAQVAG